jgi:hypothetical protein
METAEPKPVVGVLAQAAGAAFEVQVCRSAAGYYLGTVDPDGLPFSRESVAYFEEAGQAAAALAAGTWTQRPVP